MSGFDQSSIAVSMPTVVGSAAALAGPFKIKSSEAFSGALMTVSGLTGETISVQTSPDGYQGAPANPSFYRTDWQGTSLLYPSARTNLLFNSKWAGGSVPPTGWVVLNAELASLATPSIIGDGTDAAYRFTASNSQCFIGYSPTLNIGTSYTISVFVDETSGTIPAVEAAAWNDVMTGATVTYPACSANPLGGPFGIIQVGMFIMRVDTGTLATGARALRLGAGCSGLSSGTITLSRPQVEVGTSRTSFIGSPVGATATVTDYTLSNGVITLTEVPAMGATLSYDNSVLPSPYYIFATGDGVRSSFAYDGVWGTLSANSGKGNGIWQVDLRGAQAYRLVKSAGSETATVNMTLKRDALQYTNTAGTWSVT